MLSSWKVLSLNIVNMLHYEMAMVRLIVSFLPPPSVVFPHFLLGNLYNCEEGVCWEVEGEIRKNNFLWLTNFDINKNASYFL
jgi:hypothetical protein